MVHLGPSHRRRRGSAHLACARQRRRARSGNPALRARQPDVVLSVAPVSLLRGSGLASGRSGPAWDGHSERPNLPRTLASRIDDLDTITSELGITGRVVLAAHDWGGPISLGWAQRHLDQVAGLILTNTGVAVPMGADPPALIRLARSRALRELVCARTSMFVRAAAALSWPQIPVEVRRALRAPYFSSQRRQAVAEFVADIPLEPGHPSRAVLDDITCRLSELGGVPTLLLWGPRDPAFTQRYLRDLQRRLPQADVHRYSRASHLVMEDAPQAAEDAMVVGEVERQHAGARVEAGRAGTRARCRPGCWCGSR